MRLFVLLALVAFTGCQAWVVRSDEPKSQLLVARDTLWEYITQAKESAEETLENFRQSKFGQKVIAKIQDSAAVARQYATIVQDQVSVSSQESFNKVSEQVERLSERLWQDINEVRKQLEPHTEKLRENVEQRLRELQASVAPVTESIQAEVTHKISTIQESLAPYIESLREKLKPHIEDMDSQLSAFWESFTESA